MKRVHYSQPHDVLAMRPGPWGNPFSYKEHAESKFKVVCRAQSLRYYQRWLVAQPLLIKKAKEELTGKVLACCCSERELCHVDILLAVIYDRPLPLQEVEEENCAPGLFDL